MDTTTENYTELWEAKRKEYDAKADRLSAERRMEYNDAFDNLSEELDAAADWTEAGFSEFMAKADQKWQKFAIDTKD